MFCPTLSIVLFPPGVVLSSSSSAVCRGVDQAVHFGGYGYPPWLYFEIRHQKWFTVEAVAVLSTTSTTSSSGGAAKEHFLSKQTEMLKRILQQNSLAQHWARDWCALALTQVHHWSRVGKLIHNLLW